MMRSVMMALAGLAAVAVVAGMSSRAADPAPKRLRHVVLFKFKESTTKEQVQEIAEHFTRLPQQIDSIIDFEWGTDVSVENLSEGFTHCFIVTFADAAGRDKYLPHPAHKAFVEIALPRIDKALVVDFVQQ